MARMSRDFTDLKSLKTERTHEENQERAFIAASRRGDRSLEARIESAQRASKIHKARTGKSLCITTEAVLNEDMYDEEDDDIRRKRYFEHLQEESARLSIKLETARSQDRTNHQNRGPISTFSSRQHQQQQHSQNILHPYSGGHSVGLPQTPYGQGQQMQHPISAGQVLPSNPGYWGQAHFDNFPSSEYSGYASSPVGAPGPESSPIAALGPASSPVTASGYASSPMAATGSGSSSSMQNSFCVSQPSRINSFSSDGMTPATSECFSSNSRVESPLKSPACLNQQSGPAFVNQYANDDPFPMLSSSPGSMVGNPPTPPIDHDEANFVAQEFGYITADMASTKLDATGTTPFSGSNSAYATVGESPAPTAPSMSQDLIGSITGVAVSPDLWETYFQNGFWQDSSSNDRWGVSLD